jgi:sulfate-transporting ATPase
VLFALLGLGAGAAYALIAQGVILVHRATGVVNFAQGAIALISAATYVWLINAHGFSPAAATLVVVPAAGVLGAVVQRVVMRPLGRAPMLAKLVAVLGLVVVLEGVTLLAYGPDQQAVTPLLPTSSVHLFGVTVGRDRIIVFLIAIAMAAVLSLFAQRTMRGALFRAASDSEEGVAILGYSLSTIATSTWVAGSMLAGFAGILIVPITSLSSTALILLIIPAVSVALLAGFSSFWVATVAALLLGVLQSEIARFWTVQSPTIQGMQQALPFLLIILVMVLRGRSIPGRSTLTLGRPPLAPAAPRNPYAISTAIAVAVLVTAVASNSYQTAIAVGLISAIVALSLVVLTGYVGQISLAQMAFAGLGAYFCSRLAADAGLPFLVTVPLAALAVVPCGVLLGAPALRVRGVSLAVVTLGAAVAIDALVFADPQLTGGVDGISIPSPEIFGYSLDGIIHPFRYAMAVLVILVLCMTAVGVLRHSRLGLKMLATRDNERAAAAEGVDVVQTKLIAFAIASFLAGLAGALFGYLYGHLSLDAFTPLASVTFVTVAYIGGIGSITGALIAGMISAGGPVFNLLSSNNAVNKYQLLISGVGVILTAILNPDGVAPAFAENARRFRARLGGRSSAPAVAGGAPHPRRATTVLGERGPRPVSVPGGRDPAPLLEARGMRVTFGQVEAVGGVDLTVYPGSLIGLIGPNGAGKTTLIDAICGFVASTGTVRFDGADLHRMRVHQRARRGVRRTFQGTELFEDLTVRENLVVPSRGRGADHDAGDRFSIERILRLVGLEDKADKYPRELSNGESKLVGLARALRGEPRLLLLDEPAAGLDSAESRLLGSRLQSLLDLGVSIVLVDHDLELVMGICDEVVVLDRGRLLASGPPTVVRHDPLVRAAYIGAHAEDPDHRATATAGQPSATGTVRR